MATHSGAPYFLTHLGGVAGVFLLLVLLPLTGICNEKQGKTPPDRLRKPLEVQAKFSTGINQTFQLTLGGMFSDGVNFQNSITIDLKNALRNDGVLRVTGIAHTDTEDLSRDWIGAVNYLYPIAVWEKGKLVASGGLHLWRFPSVLQGRTDLIVDSGLILTQSGPFPVSVDANVKTLAVGPGRRGVGGQIYHFRALSPIPLLRRGKTQVVLQHGPSYTYANRFYGLNGNRVFRYEAGIVLQRGNWAVDTVLRQQWALQRGIPENCFWGANLSYTFQR